MELLRGACTLHDKLLHRQVFGERRKKCRLLRTQPHRVLDVYQEPVRLLCIKIGFSHVWYNLGGQIEDADRKICGELQNRCHYKPLQARYNNLTQGICCCIGA